MLAIGIIEHNGCVVCSFSSTKVEICCVCFKVAHGKMTFPFEITIALHKTQEQCRKTLSEYGKWGISNCPFQRGGFLMGNVVASAHYL